VSALRRPDLTGPNGGPIVAAVKAMERGEARPDQQRIVLNYLIDDLCGTYDLSYRPDGAGGERDTAFAEGRRFVGLELRRVITLPHEVLTKK
jgi:hypothetical protein